MDQIKSNAVRALGNLSRFMNFTCYSPTSDGLRSLNIYDSTKSTDFPLIVSKTRDSPTCTSTISKSPLFPEFNWLERIVKAFVSCVTTGNVKVYAFAQFIFCSMVFNTQ